MSDALDEMLSPAETTAPVVQTPEPQSQPRDDGGRFAPKQPEAQPEPQAAQPVPAQATPPAQAEPAKPHEAIPLPVFLDMRDKLKAAERRAQELETQSRQPQQIPSALNDPDAFARYQSDLVNSTRTNTVFDMSEVMAREKHGDEPVSKAMDWALQQAQVSPAFAAEYLRQKHPIDWAVKQQKRHALLDEIGDDVEAYKAKLIAALAPAQPGAPVAQPSPAASQQPAAQNAPAPHAPRSIASAPTAGSQHSVPTTPGSAFEAAFPT